MHYRGTLNDGTEFDSSYQHGEPLEFVCGVGMMIAGFDRAVADMEVGQVKDIHLMPEEAYGPVDPNLIFTLPIDQLPGAEELAAGVSVLVGAVRCRVFEIRPEGADGPTRRTAVMTEECLRRHYGARRKALEAAARADRADSASDRSGMVRYD